MPPVVLIGGATASGKSALALEMAAAAGGEIVNADSMQVYADLRVLTARPRAEEEAAAPTCSESPTVRRFGPWVAG